MKLDGRGLLCMALQLVSFCLLCFLKLCESVFSIVMQNFVNPTNMCSKVARQIALMYLVSPMTTVKKLTSLT